MEGRETVYRTPPLGQQDLDRNSSLAPSTLLRWMQAARMRLPWLQQGYAAFAAMDPPLPRRLVVASQMLRLRPGGLADAAGREAAMRCEVGRVGGSTVELRYRLLLDGRQVGTGTAVMVVVAGPLGSLRPSPVPEAVRALAAIDGCGDRDFLAASLHAQPPAPPPGAYRAPLVVRFSDEDANRHANHSALARYFEDAREAILADAAAAPELRALAAQGLEAVLIAYAAEARAGDRCETHVASLSPGALDLWVLRLSPREGLIGRGRLLVAAGCARPGAATPSGGRSSSL